LPQSDKAPQYGKFKAIADFTSGYLVLRIYIKGTSEGKGAIKAFMRAMSASHMKFRAIIDVAYVGQEGEVVRKTMLEYRENEEAGDACDWSWACAYKKGLLADVL
jgi:hypothetical protein